MHGRPGRCHGIVEIAKPCFVLCEMKIGIATSIPLPIMPVITQVLGELVVEGGFRSLCW
jgi:hypothetical protein